MSGSFKADVISIVRGDRGNWVAGNAYSLVSYCSFCFGNKHKNLATFYFSYLPKSHTEKNIFDSSKVAAGSAEFLLSSHLTLKSPQSSCSANHSCAHHRTSSYAFAIVLSSICLRSHRTVSLRHSVSRISQLEWSWWIQRSGNRQQLFSPPFRLLTRYLLADMCIYMNTNTMLPRAPAVCKAPCKAAFDVCLAYLHPARLRRALTNPPCVLITLTWESGSWRSACSLCFCQTAHYVLSPMSTGEMSERGKAPGVSLMAPHKLGFHPNVMQILTDFGGNLQGEMRMNARFHRLL